MERFKDKVVLVTGASRGMGKSHVQEFVKEGAFVFFTDISEAGGLQLEKELDGKAQFIKQDVSLEADWKNVIEIIKNKYGRLDILVNNAAIAIFKSVEDMDFETYQKTININQNSVFLGLHHSFELLKNGINPSVINIASMGAIRAAVGSIAYSSTKFAIKAMTEIAAQEWAHYGIRVNAVCPGVTDTPLANNPEAAEVNAEVVKSIPLGRMAQPFEITKGVLYLASSDSSYVTGISLPIDGGSLAKF